jgi:hypothetical protein
LVRRDGPLFEALLHPEFVYVNARGNHIARDFYIANYVVAPAFVWKNQSIRDLAVTDFGQFAVATMVVEDTVSVDETQRTGVYRSIYVFGRDADRWLWCAAQTMPTS